MPGISYKNVSSLLSLHKWCIVIYTRIPLVMAQVSLGYDVLLNPAVIRQGRGSMALVKLEIFVISSIPKTLFDAT